MVLKLLILTSLLALLFAEEFYLYKEELTTDKFDASAIAGYISNKGTDILSDCGGKTIIGGQHKFGEKTKLTKKFSNLPFHGKLKVDITLYWVDSPDPHYKVYISIDNTRLKTLYKYPDAWGGSQICGRTDFGEKINKIQLQLDHDQDSFELKFEDNFDQSSWDESWGIREVRVYLDQKCDENSGQLIGKQCFTKEKLSQCSSSLKNVKGNIDSDCKQNTSSGSLVYDFEIQYQNPYVHSTTCFSQEIFAEDTKLVQNKQWKFDETSQKIQFSIPHDDLEPKYSCKKTVSTSEIEWECDFKLHILLGEKVQHIFKFHFSAELDKEVKEVLSLNVVADEEQGDCCINELGVNTQIKFCKTFECNSYHELPFTAVRNDPIYIEKSITNQEFKYLYLHPSEIYIFGAKADILDFNGSVPGKLIYKTTSYLAFDDMLVEVISFLDESPKTKLRFLNDQVSLRKDYDIKGLSQITIISEDKKVDDNKQDGEVNDVKIFVTESGNEEVLIYSLIGVGSALGIGIIVLVGYCIRYKCYNNNHNNNRQSQYQE